MPDGVLSALVQAPFVVAVVFVVVRFLRHMEERDKVLQELVEAVGALGAAIEAHDTFVRAQQTQERVRLAATSERS